MISQPNNFKITDCHTHILPSMDDGSISVSMSLEMLKMSKESGITSFVASSHFYANEDEPTSFLKRRNDSFGCLKEAIQKTSSLKGLKIFLAAEVAYFPGIGNSTALKSLCIEGTNYILVEMPFYKWDDSIVEDVLNLKRRLGLNIILVHVDRYLKLGFKKYEKIFSNNEVLFQFNSESFLEKRLSKKLLRKYYSYGKVHLLGSDMHNLTNRKTTLKEAIEILSEFDPNPLQRIQGLEKFIFSLK